MNYWSVAKNSLLALLFVYVSWILSFTDTKFSPTPVLVAIPPLEDEPSDLLSLRCQPHTTGLRGPEHIAYHKGTLLVGAERGVYAVDAASGANQGRLFLTGGRPEGLAVHGDDVWVADAHVGLGRWDALSGWQLLASFPFANAVSVSARGDFVVVTQSSTKYGLDAWHDDFLEGQSNGRLLLYNVSEGSLLEVARDLVFANGVVLVNDDREALVAESGAARITRISLETGEKSLFAETHFVDNLVLDRRGLVYAAMNGRVDWMTQFALNSSWLRRILRLLPLGGGRWAMVVVYHPNGTVVQVESDATGSALKEAITVFSPSLDNDKIMYAGSFTGDVIYKCDLNE